MTVPNPGDISYGNTPPGSTYGPYTEKSVMYHNFLALANQNPSLVDVEVIGQGSHNWDMVIFKVGNPSGGVIFWDSCIHGLEDFGVEALFSLYQWLLTPNSNPAQEARRQRILSRNYVIFFPYINWRWSRMNYNYSATHCSGTDQDGDKGPLAVNCARDFRNGHQENCPDNYAPPGGYTQPETQAMIAAWNKYNSHSNGWFYVNLHMGTNSRRGSGTRKAEVETLRASIYTELFGGYKEWIIGTGASHAPADAIQYYDAIGGWTLELGGSDWRRTSTAYTSLTRGTIHRELLSLLVSQAQLIEDSEPPPTKHILKISSSHVASVTVDGVALGDTPVQLEVSEGPHVIEVPAEIEI